MIPAAFHGHTLTGGKREAVLQNEDSSCSVRECNTSNTTSTPIISDVRTAADADTACTMCSGLYTANHILLEYQYEYVRAHCLSLETNVSVYSHEARMNVLSVEQYRTTYGRTG